MKLKNNIDKFGTAGLFLTAILSPCCFPIFAFVASVLGFGSTVWTFDGNILELSTK